MKKAAIISLFVASVSLPFPSMLAAQGLKWSDSYTFDRCNHMKVDFYGRGGDLIRTLNYKTYYKSDGVSSVEIDGGLTVPADDYAVMMDSPVKGNDIVTIFDMTHTTAIQIFGSDLEEPMYNAGGWKYPPAGEIKKLELVPADETRVICGYTCRKYTYAFKKITGSVWITADVKLPNDLGIFRAAKMSALHNSPGVEGFILEMTSEDDRGGKTVMTTVSLENSETRTITLPEAKVGKAINRVSYFSF